MSKKTSKGTRPAKPSAAAIPAAPSSSTAPEGGARIPAPGLDETASRILRVARRWFPAAGVVLALVLGSMYGVGLGVLVLAATALLLAISAIWASLQVLAGDRSEGIEHALPLTLTGGEVEQKAYLLRALKDLEFERSLGKISEQDYEDLKRTYRARAKQVLQQLDKQNESARLEAERLADKYLASRGLTRKGNDASDMARDAGAHPDPAQRDRRTCGACGTDNESDALFCKKCGNPMDAKVDESEIRSDAS
jgi:hypothetical protein